MGKVGFRVRGQESCRQYRLESLLSQCQEIGRKSSCFFDVEKERKSSKLKGIQKIKKLRNKAENFLM